MHVKDFRHVLETIHLGFFVLNAAQKALLEVEAKLT